MAGSLCDAGGRKCFFAPPKYPKVAQKHVDLVTVQAMEDVQLPFHIYQTILSQVVMCVL